MSIRTSWRLPAAAVAAVVLLVGCGSSDGDLGGTVVKDGLGCKATQVDRRTDAPKVEKLAKAPKDVEREDLEKGKGCGISTDTFVTLDLIGATALDGKVFTDTFAEGRPITSTMGSGKLLTGLESGLSGMKVGGRREIVLPADQAYGKDGNPAQGIAADQPLTFVVDLVAVTDSPLYCAAPNIPAGPKDSGKPSTVEMPVKAPTGKVTTKDLQVGKGKAVKKGNYVTVNYIGVACSTGEQFDSSWDNGQPFPITLGEGTIPGFATGIEGMKAGGLRQIDIPFELAYGAAGNPPTIGPKEPLVFVVQVVSFEDKPPASTTTAVPDSTTTAPAGDGKAGATTTTTAADDAEAATTSTAAP